MKHRAVALVLMTSLLTLATAGIPGCGNTNTLSSLVLLPAVPVVAKGSAQLLLATAVFSDGLLVTGWTRVTWTSSDPAKVAVSSIGVVTGNEVGTAVITATDMSHPSISASVTVSVTELDAIKVTPLSANISLGTSTQFTAIGTYSALSPSSWFTSTTWPDVDITTSVLWTSSSTTVATIGSSGLATAASSTGTTTITATSQTGTLRTGTATLTVF